MSQSLIVALQAALIFLQIVNGQIAVVTHNTLIALIIGAAVGALQYFVQHLGNASLSPENAEALKQAGVTPEPPQTAIVPAAPAAPAVPAVPADTKTTGW
jgi:hypothetical protein